MSAIHNNGATDLDSLLKGYCLCARSEGKSPKYISLVVTAAKSLLRYLKEKHLPIDVSQVDAQQLRGFILDLQSVKRFQYHRFARPQGNGLAGHTINTYLRSLSALWSWLEREGILEQNPFTQIKIPKAPQKIIPTFSEQQIRELLAQIDTTTSTGFRDYSIFLLLLDTMVRVSELTGCRMEDLDLEARSLTVWGKGAKQRIVPFGRTAQKALWKYIAMYRAEPQIPRQDMVFLTADGRPMTKNRIETILKAYGQKAGIKGVRVSPHTFRHTGAVEFLRNGGDLFTLQRIMGHSSLQVLRGYVNLNQGDLARAHEMASPLDNLGITAPKTRRMREKSPACSGQASITIDSKKRDR